MRDSMRFNYEGGQPRAFTAGSLEGSRSIRRDEARSITPRGRKEMADGEDVMLPPRSALVDPPSSSEDSDDFKPPKYPSSFSPSVRNMQPYQSSDEDGDDHRVADDEGAGGAQAGEPERRGEQKATGAGATKSEDSEQEDILLVGSRDKAEAARVAKEEGMGGGKMEKIMRELRDMIFAHGHELARLRGQVGDGESWHMHTYRQAAPIIPARASLPWALSRTHITACFRKPHLPVAAIVVLPILTASGTWPC